MFFTIKYYKFSFEDMLPAPGQGALAVEIRKNNEKLEHMLTKIDNTKIRESVEVERVILNNIGGGCCITLGAITFSKINLLLAGIYKTSFLLSLHSCLLLLILIFILLFKLKYDVLLSNSNT